MLIANNGITTYDEFLDLLDRLKVSPLPESEFNTVLKQINIAKISNDVKETKDEPINKKKTTKAVKPRRSRNARGPKSKQPAKRKTTTASKNGNISKKE
tara:strand:- start:56 stop:352 length:297 start_codon:yes stop_codon:yes gene_type:complete